MKQKLRKVSFQEFTGVQAFRSLTLKKHENLFDEHGKKGVYNTKNRGFFFFYFTKINQKKT
jgi:hypothetical protein